MNFKTTKAIFSNMLGNYLKTAVRNLLKRKSFSLINVAGLAIGMAVCFLILLLVLNEVTYDRFHENSESIYRVALNLDIQDRHMEIPTVPPPFGPALVEQFPEIAGVARLRREGRKIVSFEDKLFEESRIYYADPGLFDVFAISLVNGDPETMLEAPFSLVLTEEMTEKYFGSEDPIGKMLKLDNEHMYTITGVVKKMPENSHFKYNMLASLSTLNRLRGDMNMWMNFNFFTYILLTGKPNTEEITKKYHELLMANLPDQVKKLGVKISLFLQPLQSIHLHSHMEGEMEPPGNPAYIRILTSIALFILLIACINFMNLSTAQSAQRAKEVGMRKVLGAPRGKLIAQFLGESMLLSFISLVIAVILIQIMLPIFNRLVSKDLAFNPMQNGIIILGLVGITLLVGLIAGVYPAFFLSSFAPLEILKSRFKAGKGHRFFRHGLVSLQYVISITLIFCTLVIFYQLHHVKNHDLGFNKEQIAVISLKGQAHQKSDVFKNEILRIPGVVNATCSSHVPGIGMNETTFSFEGVTQEKQIMPYVEADDDYLDTFGIELAAGRNLSKDRPSDKRAIILNETLVKQLGWDNPLGKTVIMTDVIDRKFVEVSYTVIGVVRDFHFESLHQKIRGYLMKLPGELYSRISAKLNPENLSETLRAIEKQWQQIEPAYPFHYVFVDESFDRLYRSEQRMGQVFISFTLIAIFIACLGLFGLASFTAEQRTKEIGIRKVLGASVSNVVLLLSREFTKWVMLANVIAWPFAYFAMNKWLQNFAYRIEVELWIFILSGLIALIIALLTISTKAVRAATADPVDSLRYE
ncbi:MAG: ABC transporter permease [Candidatus Aminicenantes bacterium]|nr:MAG: ABC transporter permease [Candidatus Aminicenantes bacterium]